MTKYIASFAILSGAQLGSVFGQTGKKVLLSFPIDKRKELSLGQLPTAIQARLLLQKGYDQVQIEKIWVSRHKAFQHTLFEKVQFFSFSNLFGFTHQSFENLKKSIGGKIE